MKKQIFTLAALAATLFSGFMADAAIIRCNNTLPAGTRQFATWATAYAAAASGDTIYLEPSPTSYGDLTLTKQLTIVGNGFYLTENYPTYTNRNSSVVGNLTFNAGSEGTVVTGVNSGGRFVINASNIRLSRNAIQEISVYSSNVIISQNLISNQLNDVGCCGNFGNYNGSNLIISNNIFNTSNAIGLRIEGSGAATIENNIFKTNVTKSNSEFKNNIFLGTTITGTNNSLSYNIATSSNLLPTGQNNINGQSDLFNTSNTTSDKQWELDPNSPAKGAGFGDVDCGVFGGPNPYILSGIPSFPYVTNFTVPANSNGNTLNFVFTASSNK